MKKPAILAFDTCMDSCSVALRVADEIMCEHKNEPRAHAKVLLPMIDSVLARANTSLAQLDAIAFTQGPGSFTGVRIAASVAQGLAFGAQLPVIPVSSLAVLAQGKVDEAADCLIVALLNARMGEVYAGFYALDEHVLRQLRPDALLQPKAVIDILEQEFPLQAIAAVGAGWQLLEEDRLTVENRDDAAEPLASQLLVLAEKAWQEGSAVSAELALPVYLRDSSAWRKMPTRAV